MPRPVLAPSCQDRPAVVAPVTYELASIGGGIRMDRAMPDGRKTVVSG